MTSGHSWYSYPTAPTGIVSEAAVAAETSEQVTFVSSRTGKRRTAPAPEPLEWSIGCQAAADMVGVHYRSMWAWARAGKVPCARIGNRWRFSPEKLREWAERGGMDGAA